MDQNQKKLSNISFGAGILLSFAGLYMYSRSEKPMKEFESVTGKITYLADGDGSFHDPKTRYLEIEGYPKAFSIFIGMDPGDFSPKSQQIDKLKVGDMVTVYHENTPFQKNRDPNLDKGIQYLEKDGVLYFEKGNKDKYFGYFFIPMGILIAAFSYFRGKKLKSIDTQPVQSEIKP